MYTAKRLSKESVQPIVRAAARISAIGEAEKYAVVIEYEQENYGSTLLNDMRNGIVVCNEFGEQWKVKFLCVTANNAKNRKVTFVHENDQARLMKFGRGEEEIPGIVDIMKREAWVGYALTPSVESEFEIKEGEVLIVKPKYPAGAHIKYDALDLATGNVIRGLDTTVEEAHAKWGTSIENIIDGEFAIDADKPEWAYHRQLQLKGASQQYKGGYTRINGKMQWVSGPIFAAICNDTKGKLVREGIVDIYGDHWTFGGEHDLAKVRIVLTPDTVKGAKYYSSADAWVRSARSNWGTQLRNVIEYPNSKGYLGAQQFQQFEGLLNEGRLSAIQKPIVDKFNTFGDTPWEFAPKFLKNICRAYPHIMRDAYIQSEVSAFKNNVLVKAAGGRVIERERMPIMVDPTVVIQCLFGLDVTPSMGINNFYADGKVCEAVLTRDPNQNRCACVMQGVRTMKYAVPGVCYIGAYEVIDGTLYQTGALRKMYADVDGDHVNISTQKEVVTAAKETEALPLLYADGSTPDKMKTNADGKMNMSNVANCAEDVAENSSMGPWALMSYQVFNNPEYFNEDAGSHSEAGYSTFTDYTKHGGVAFAKSMLDEKSEIRKMAMPDSYQLRKADCKKAPDLLRSLSFSGSGVNDTNARFWSKYQFPTFDFQALEFDMNMLMKHDENSEVIKSNIVGWCWFRTECEVGRDTFDHYKSFCDADGIADYKKIRTEFMLEDFKAQYEGRETEMWAAFNGIVKQLFNTRAITTTWKKWFFFNVFGEMLMSVLEENGADCSVVSAPEYLNFGEEDIDLEFNADMSIDDDNDNEDLIQD